ncbi:MAG: DUF362 domain-containing protein [Candidatus Edwardsbacteria bacterium]
MQSLFKLQYTRVALIRCRDYERSTVTTSIRQALALVGGLESIVKPGQRVLLKVNLLSARKPEEAVTTHPEVVRALALEVKKAGGIPVIGDSPSITGELNRCWQVTGIKQVAEELNLKLINFETSGILSKRINSRTYWLAKPALDADVIINIPKLKTHHLTLLTCGIKNLFGVIPGLRKTAYHKEFLKPKAFSKILVDIFSLVKPQLTVVDGIVGMEGAGGPSTGKIRPIGLIIAGTDAVAVDVLVTKILGKNPLSIYTTQIAFERGLGEADLEKIEILGEPIENVTISDFEWPVNWYYQAIPMLPIKLLKGLHWIRPTIAKGRCEGCGFCVQICPTSALSFLNSPKIPEFNYKLCINCFCCAEVCPSQAIEQKRSRIARVVRQLRRIRGVLPSIKRGVRGVL